MGRGSTHPVYPPSTTQPVPPRVRPPTADMPVPGTNTVYWTPGTCQYGRFRRTQGDPRGVKRTGHATAGTGTHAHRTQARTLALPGCLWACCGLLGMVPAGFQVPVFRFPYSGSRIQVPVSRFPYSGSRIQVPVLRCPFSGARAEAQLQELMRSSAAMPCCGGINSVRQLVAVPVSSRYAHSGDTLPF